MSDFVNDRINKIFRHKKYRQYIDKIEHQEKNRVFCRHNIDHFLAVGRIAYIISLEKRLNIKKDIIYAVALLHDIGRWLQYEKGMAHEEASSELAEEILIDAGFEKSEIEIITEAIINHRRILEDKEDLNSIIYKSDKLSRNCFNCVAEKECNWSKDKKNFTIIY